MNKGKHEYRCAIVRLLGVLLFCMLLGQAAWAVPGRMNYQGALSAADGAPLADGNYSITFSLYDAAVGGNLLWQENQSVALAHGVFSVELGAVTAIPEPLFNADCYLGIAVESDPEMTPRHQLLSVGYAFKASDADTLDGMDSTAFGDIFGVTAGTGLTGGGDSGEVTVNVDTGYVQRRVASSCVSGSSIRVINADGTVVCEGDDDSGGDITSVAAGTGLTGGGVSGAVSLDVDTSYVQRRVSNSCLPGYSIRVINADGSIVCEADDDSGGDIQGVTAGTGLTGGGSSGTVTLNAAVPFSLTSASAGSVISGSSSYVGNYTTRGYGVFGSASGSFGRGVYGYTSNDLGTAVYAYAGGTGIGIYGYSAAGPGIQAGSGGSSSHGGYFYNLSSVGLNGAALYARASNSTDGNGIAFWAHNDHSTSTDATVVVSNDGTGPLLKGFGGDGGEEEIRIDNNGSIHVLDPSIYDDVLYFSASTGALALGSGTSTTTGDDGDLYIYNSSGTYTIRMDGESGTTYTRVLRVTGGSDLAEHFDVDRQLRPEPGMLVSIDPEHPGKLMVSSEAYDKKVAGIISGAGGVNTGMTMGQAGTMADGALPVALTGRVYCMVDTSRGAIQPGDLLTTSDKPGYAMKVTDHRRATGAIIGKAMTPLEDGTGMVLVLVSLQ